ncbi:hypothetical protein V1224_05470 [Lachnospiraceae bacterium JLR.KK008]
MTGNIRNRNVRFYEEKEADRRAWEILHSEAVRAFPSQNDFIIQAINDFYDRHLAISDDPYLETREKEDAFADRIVEKVEQKVLGNLSQLIGIYLLQQNILATGNDARAENYLKENGEMQVLSSGGGILQNGGEAETEELEENEFLDFSFGG